MARTGVVARRLSVIIARSNHSGLRSTTWIQSFIFVRAEEDLHFIDKCITLLSCLQFIFLEQKSDFDFSFMRLLMVFYYAFS